MATASFDFSGKTVCVTGASSGIGRALATGFANVGAHVIGVARRQKELSSWSNATKGKTSIVIGDLANKDNINNIAAEILSHGPVDILLNAAGVNLRQNADVVTAQGWDLTLDLNLRAPFFLAQKLVPQMRNCGWGRIINFASLQSQRAFSNGIAYGASKGGICQLTRAMAEAWSHSGITTNAIAPGFFPTELTGPVFNDPALANKNAQQTCIGRNGELEDLIGPVLFLCSDQASYITGQTLYIDGGFTAR